GHDHGYAASGRVDHPPERTHGPSNRDHHSRAGVARSGPAARGRPPRLLVAGWRADVRGCPVNAVETNTQCRSRGLCDGELRAAPLVRRAWGTVAVLEADLACEGVL